MDSSEIVIVGEFSIDIYYRYSSRIHGKLAGIFLRRSEESLGQIAVLYFSVRSDFLILSSH